MRRLRPLFLLLLTLLVGVASASTQSQAKQRILWTDPGDVASRNLYYGVGGKEHVPQPPMTFLNEERGGTNPKFEARDQAGTKWKVKLGVESKPEVAASRLLWAMGYFANENYYVSDLEVDGLKHIKRWRQFSRGDHVLSARLQRHAQGEKKVRRWGWRHNPFKGSREFDGLRVMMALISNWDLKSDNNAIFEDVKHRGVEDYAVSDVGTAFGTSGKSYSSDVSKSNIEAYRKHKFVAKVTTDYVDLNFPTHPSFIHFFEFPFFWGQIANHWVGRHIPREHVRWIASLLVQLKPEQIRDAFRAAGYPPNQVEEYAQAVEARIAELKGI